MKLLIADDNSEMRRLIRSLVATSEDEVCECSSGSEAVAAYREHVPDWVFMDVKMPVLDGTTAARLIKAAFPRARIVMVSQYDDVEMREAARDAGAIEYVLKDDLSALNAILGRTDKSCGKQHFGGKTRHDEPVE